MKIKNIHIQNFKRFTDLTIYNIPESAKLVVLVGPNGCGKTSLFEAFNYWYKWTGFGSAWDEKFYLKSNNNKDNKSVLIDFYSQIDLHISVIPVQSFR